MNSKKWLLLTTSLFVLFGCGQPGETSVSPTPAGTQYTAEDLFETADEKETVTLPGESVENQEATEFPEITEVPEYLKPQENIEYVKYDAANRFRSPDYTRDLNSMFCLDPDTGVAYFVNQNKDWYIYRLVNDNVELVINLPARELYVLNGKVYFILEDYDKYVLQELTEGDVYAYTIATGYLERVFQADRLQYEIYRMKPYEDGIAIHCRVLEQKTEHFYYYYTYASDVLENDMYMRTLPGWKDYYLTWNQSDNKINVWNALWSREKQDKEQLNFEVVGESSFIVEDTLYQFSGARISCMNLITGEQNTYDINAMFKSLVPKLADRWEEDNVEVGIHMSGYTVTKDYIWAIVLGPLIVGFDPASGKSVCFCLEGINCSAYELYTDGINLYATYEQRGLTGPNEGYIQRKDKSALVRICTETIIGNSKDYDVPVIAVEYLTD